MTSKGTSTANDAGGDNNANYSQGTLDTFFDKAVVPASAKFWSHHFSPSETQNGIKAAFSFAHLMDELCFASSEVIHQKSVWWHEELQRFVDGKSRHPLTRALQPYLPSIAEPLHQQLHGALMTQQRTAIDSIEDWHQYCDMRVGSLFNMLRIINHQTDADALRYAMLAGRLVMAGTFSAPHLFDDHRWSHPGIDLQSEQNTNTAITPLETSWLNNTRAGNPASAVLVYHEQRWLSQNPISVSTASPFYTNTPLGVPGMFRSWRAARNAS